MFRHSGEAVWPLSQRADVEAACCLTCESCLTSGRPGMSHLASLYLCSLKVSSLCPRIALQMKS